jgi:signal transduction histidine kinase
MFVAGSDAFFTVVAAAYAAALGLWSGRLLERRTLERLEAEERVRRQLVADVSHDLRTPITSLRLLVEAVQDGLVAGAARDDYLHRMSTHVRTLSSLIDDLFELTRLAAGDIRWGMERVELDELVLETVEAMRAHAEAGAVRVAAELPNGGAVARTNPEQLQRVLFNLLQNAIRHTPPDGSVVVRAEPRDGVVEIEVADTGEGIPAADRARVFDPFVQGAARAARSDGSAGLGLAIARAIVEAQGGRIWLEDSTVGTRVRFSVPRG